MNDYTTTADSCQSKGLSTLFLFVPQAVGQIEIERELAGLIHGDAEENKE